MKQTFVILLLNCFQVATWWFRIQRHDLFLKRAQGGNNKMQLVIHIYNLSKSLLSQWSTYKESFPIHFEQPSFMIMSHNWIQTSEHKKCDIINGTTNGSCFPIHKFHFSCQNRLLLLKSQINTRSVQS